MTALEKIWLQVPSKYYEEGIRRNFFQKLWHNRKWMVLKETVEGKPGTVLDVGCASGWLTARMAKILPEAKITGLDVSQKMIRYARKKHPGINFICADAHKLPFPDKSFDLIVCTETLEHVVDPLGVLLEIRRCLSPKGQVIISMDTGSRLFNLAWLFWLRAKGRVWQGAHLHKFNMAKLKSLFKKASFRIIKQRTSHLGMAATFKLMKA